MSRSTAPPASRPPWPTPSVPLALLGLAAGLAAAAGLGVWRAWRRGLPRLAGELRLRGLEAEVEIRRDPWGVPHLSARSNADLFFGLGFVHAQDRLWQIDLNRRLARGRLAEAFGPQALEVDRFFRRLGLHRAAEADLESASQPARAVLEAYARGVNAYLEQAQGRLPLEYAFTRLQPLPWSAADSLVLARLIAWMLSCNWDTELFRERFIAHLGPELAAALEPAIPAELFRRPSPAPPPPSPRLKPPPDGLPDPGLAAAGSNAWVVSGARSVTGKPLLANDPHLLLLLPPIFYEVHLRGGDYHVAGAGPPGLPGLPIGHNERLAWGLTLALVDAQDLYVERLDPSDPARYEYQGAWERGRVIWETIQVRGQLAPVVERVLVTRHGPVLTPCGLLPGEDRPLALRSVALEPSAGIEPLLALNRATSWDEFRRALADWTAPGLNLVYADVDGNIGYQLAARVPVRAAGSGLVPAPGWVADYEWRGWVPFEALPCRLNPPEGYLASANDGELAGCVDRATDRREDGAIAGARQGSPAPAGRVHLSWEWAAPYRYRRICEVLAGRARHSPRDFRDLQLDVVCLPARQVAAYLTRLLSQPDATDPTDAPPLPPAPRPRVAASAVPLSPDEAWALAELAAWDGSLDADSAAAALYGAFKTTFLQRRYGHTLGDLLPAFFGHGHHPLVNPTTTYYLRLSLLLVDVLSRHGDEPEVRQQAREALRDALALLRRRLGPDRRAWRWGRLHRLTLRHTLSARKPLSLLFDLGPFPLPGDADTPRKAAAIPPSLEVNASCAAYRFICDLSDWDNSVAVLPGGQSGQRPSPHYADQLGLWLRGEYRPMPFSRDAVESHTRATLWLRPASDR